MHCHYIVPLTCSFLKWLPLKKGKVSLNQHALMCFPFLQQDGESILKRKFRHIITVTYVILQKKTITTQKTITRIVQSSRCLWQNHLGNLFQLQSVSIHCFCRSDWYFWKERLFSCKEIRRYLVVLQYQATFWDSHAAKWCCAWPFFGAC